MRLYLDTSDLLKIYVEQEGSDEIRRRTTEATTLSTSALAYVEARSALARLRRENTLSASKFSALKRKLEDNWPKFVAVKVSDSLLREAGEFAERYRLRGADSIHLASFAEVVRDHAPHEVEFCSSDKQLDRAARALASRLAGKRPSWVKAAEKN